MKPVLSLRIIVVDPPAGVAFALQRDRAELIPATSDSPSRFTFEFTVEVADATKLPPRLVGKFTQGPADARFVYINSGTYAGQHSPWSRRAKVPLGGIDAALIKAALERGRVLEASIRGTGRDGGPVCASVPLASGWTLAD